MQDQAPEISETTHPTPPAPRLSFDDGPLSGERIALERELTTVGRSSTNDCVVIDPRISRIHAQIRRDIASVIVTDLGSRSGTWLNGELLTGPAVAHHGEQLRFGPITATLEDVAAASDPAEDTLVFGAPMIEVGPRLSPRQQQVLELMAKGLTNIEIGQELSISERTVKAYAHELFDRLDVHNRAGAVAQGIRHGLV